jgi:ABC-type multidrug transport system ATPase subunit
MIEVQNLSKKYGKIEAVKNISFTVEKGEILGFLGPNGAGKSTTMNMKQDIFLLQKALLRFAVMILQSSLKR